jgi:DNA-binding transcriptional LysR family regulator
MEQFAIQVEQQIAARDTGLQGSIVVTSVDWFGEHVLAPILAKFCTREPFGHSVRR